jgi:hypothetical protein
MPVWSPMRKRSGHHPLVRRVPPTTWRTAVGFGSRLPVARTVDPRPPAPVVAVRSPAGLHRPKPPVILRFPHRPRVRIAFATTPRSPPVSRGGAFVPVRWVCAGSTRSGPGPQVRRPERTAHPAPAPNQAVCSVFCTRTLPSACHLSTCWVPNMEPPRSVRGDHSHDPPFRLGPRSWLFPVPPWQ